MLEWRDLSIQAHDWPSVAFMLGASETVQLEMEILPSEDALENLGTHDLSTGAINCHMRPSPTRVLRDDAAEV